MKSLVDLLECLLLDCGRLSAAPVTRDVLTLRSRVEHEGDSFITITLPRYCQDFERCLDMKRVGPGLFRSFKIGHSGIPRFLGGFLSKVFGKDGFLLPKPSISCIRSIRQICLFGKRVLRPCSLRREQKAVEVFKQVDCDVDDSFPGQLGRWYDAVAKVLNLCLQIDMDDFTSSLSPSHGPGATQEHISGNQKFVFKEWHERLERVGFSYLKYGRSTRWRDELDFESYPDIVEPERERPVRVHLVPKTLATSRTIAIEPVCVQYAQQAVRKYLYERVESCALTRGHVNFRDQKVNQRLARDASRVLLGCNDLATLDMSEASDRVSVTHVMRLFAGVPELRSWIFACRSSRAELPTGEVIPLRKYASMGSALCFPVEALVFFTSIIASRLHRAGIWPTTRNVRSFASSVYVYGDDLIVPVGEAAAICDDLESLGFKVNRRKSFWSGNFRESCGVDCYDNEEVTPVYLRRDLPADRKDVSGLLSAIATCNQLEKAGYVVAAAAIREAVEYVLGELPHVHPESPVLGWHGSSEAIPSRRWNSSLQRRELLCWVPVPSRSPDPLEGYPALSKCLSKMTRKGSSAAILEREQTECAVTISLSKGMDTEHLETSVRRYGLTLKRRWVPSFLV